MKEEIISYQKKWGGYILKANSGDLYHCNSDDEPKKYYEKYNNETQQFEITGWMCGELDGLDLGIIYPND